MIGIILTTHSDFAKGLKNAIEMIAGEQKDFESICFNNGESVDDLKNRIVEVATMYKQNGNEVIYVADMLGASPFNASLAAAAEIWGPVLAGASLPMLMELVLTREYAEADLSSYVKNVINNVKENIQIIDIHDLMG